MAATYGQMRDQILRETYRFGNTDFVIAVQDALVSAVKELEIEQMFLNQKFINLPVGTNQFIIPLPDDFITLLSLTLLDQNFQRIYTPASGFLEVTFWELQTYRWQQFMPGIPASWAMYENAIHLWPTPPGDFNLALFYYNRDGYYPNDYVASPTPGDPAIQAPWTIDQYDLTSIWLGDFTEDVTRYTARSIFYRDSLQSPELAASDRAQAQYALSQLRLRNSQRDTTPYLSR